MRNSGSVCAEKHICVREPHTDHHEIRLGGGIPTTVQRDLRKQERRENRAPTPLLVLIVWSGHSCPLPLTLHLTLLSISFRDNRKRPHNRERAALQTPRKRSEWNPGF
jgi:hypothetical protein